MSESEVCNNAALVAGTLETLGFVKFFCKRGFSTNQLKAVKGTKTFEKKKTKNKIYKRPKPQNTIKHHKQNPQNPINQNPNAPPGRTHPSPYLRFDQDKAQTIQLVVFQARLVCVSHHRFSKARKTVASNTSVSWFGCFSLLKGF